jgi:thiamine phosphate synthase YjbQ (UPF0047 family)
MGREVVVAVTGGRLDFGTWERIFQGQVEWLARESQRAAEAGVGVTGGLPWAPSPPRS